MKRFFSTLAITAFAFMALSCEQEPVMKDPVVLNVTTNEITNILDTTADGGGTVSSESANASVTERGICWSNAENPTIEDSKTVDGKGLGTFTSKMTGLVGGTTYYVRAYATCDGNTTYGNQVSFTAGVIPAQVETVAITDIGQENALGGGRIVSEGTLPVEAVGLCWNTSPSPTLDNDYTEEDIAEDGSFTTELTYLDFNTTYYVRAYARAGENVYYGNEVSFTTLSETVLTIPDHTFKTFLLELADTNKDGEIQESEAEMVVEINLSNRADITNVDGINGFKNLVRCYLGTTEGSLVEAGQYNKIANIDVSGLAYLESLWISNTGVSSLNVTGCGSLWEMHALANNLTTLDISTVVKLRELHLNESFNLGDIDFSQNTELVNIGLIHTAVKNVDLSNHVNLLNVWGEGTGMQSLNFEGCSKLNGVYVNYNALPSINLKGCTLLRELHAVGNQITSLDLSDNTALWAMHINNNPITALDLSNQRDLFDLGIIGTAITSLDLSNKPAMNGLWSEASQLQSLDLSNTVIRSVFTNNAQLTNINLDGCTSLFELHAVNNKLTSIDLSDLSSLEFMHINDNQLENVDLSGLKKITELGMINNKLTTLDLTPIKGSIRKFWGPINQLTSVDVTGCSLLEYLELGTNQNLAAITGLETCNNLMELKCETTGISSISLTNHPNLWLLWAHTCPNLTSVDLTCPALRCMFFSVNDNLEVLDISRCADAMEYLHAHVSPKLLTIKMRREQTFSGDFILQEGAQIQYVN